MSKTLERLEAQVNELLVAYQHLQLENAMLRKKEASLANKNRLAAEKIELILSKLPHTVKGAA